MIAPPTSSRPLQGAIIDLLNERPMTLADLQTITGASLPTVRKLLQQLHNAGWVKPIGQNASTGGRPATLFGLEQTSRLIIGVHVEIPTINMVTTGLGGELLDKRHITVDDDLAPETAVRVVAEYVDHIRQTYPEREVLGIGLAAPGYIDPASGTILYIGRARGWQNYPLVNRLTEGLGLPVILENDTNCLIRAEIDNSALSLDRDFVYLAVLEGVKMSMLLNGRIHRGPFGNAGLIGRTRIAGSETGAAAPTDLEEVASVRGLCTRFDHRANGSASDQVTIDILSKTSRNQKYQAILHAAADGHPVAQTVVNEMLEALIESIVNMLFIIQPAILIIGGQLNTLPEIYRLQLERRIRDRLPTLLANQLTIRYATVTGRYAAAHGATHWFRHHQVATGRVFAPALTRALPESP